ncbi:MAG: DNA repair protein RecN [Alphaproteobacteria bacterium]
MLIRLSIRDVVVIDRLDLEFGRGLCALTGETGTGKSILLDALSLALGRRAEPGLVRRGASQATVTATFELLEEHVARSLLKTRGIVVDGELVVRRTLNSDGRSRAFVNDQSVTIGFLAELGAALIEIHGQNDRLGLLDPGTHRATLDVAGGLGDFLTRTEQAYGRWHDAHGLLTAGETEAEAARRDEAELRQDLSELKALAPRVGEESKLAEHRALLRQASVITEALAKARAVLFIGNERPVEEAVRVAHRTISDISGSAEGRLDALVSALDRTSIELEEAVNLLETIGHDLDLDPNKLPAVEERLFTLRDFARKHSSPVDELPQLEEEIERKLSTLDASHESLKLKRTALIAADSDLENEVKQLRNARFNAAKELDLEVVKEVEGLRMGGTKFRTEINPLPREKWSAAGADQIGFTVATVTGSKLGPIHKIASGGELSRFMLALRVVIASAGHAGTIVFDEIDSGIGGAVADAVGQRLARLSSSVQVLVVTHQPQIAARASHHFQVSKPGRNGKISTRVEKLSHEKRIEEVARMLAGARVTDEARAAADRLILEAES